MHSRGVQLISLIFRSVVSTYAAQLFRKTEPGKKKNIVVGLVPRGVVTVEVVARTEISDYRRGSLCSMYVKLYTYHYTVTIGMTAALRRASVLR